MFFAKYSRSAGIALLEVLISLFILIGGIAIFTAFHSVLTRSGGLAKQTIQALNYAQSKIEYFRSYAVINTTSGYLAYQNIINGSDVPSAAAGDNTIYSRSWTVIDCPTSSNAQCSGTLAYKIVDVRVTWTDAANTSQAVELVTIISQSDPANSGSVIG